MNYEFHVGDYVEDIEGKIGYIVKLQDYGADWYCIQDNKIYGLVVIDKINKDDYSYIYNRIGKYDFTKPEQPKEIKKLQDGYGDGYVLYKGMTAVDGTVDNGWVSIGVLSSKINELVDAVNELRNK